MNLDAGTTTITDIGGDKLEDATKKKDRNENKVEDVTNEVLPLKSDSANLPSTLALNPAAMSGNQPTGEGGESVNRKAPDNKELHDDSSCISGAVSSLNDNIRGTSGDSQSLVLMDSESIQVEKDQGLNSGTLEAATTFGSMPVAVESGKTGPFHSKEDEKVLVSAKHMDMDESPISENLSKGVTDDVELKQGAVPAYSISGRASTDPGAVASGDQPDSSIVSASGLPSVAQDIADPSAGQVLNGRFHSLFEY